MATTIIYSIKNQQERIKERQMLKYNASAVQTIITDISPCYTNGEIRTASVHMNTFALRALHGDEPAGNHRHT